MANKIPVGQACWNRIKDCPGISVRRKRKAGDARTDLDDTTPSNTEFCKTCEMCDVRMSKSTLENRCIQCKPRLRNQPDDSKPFDFITNAMRSLFATTLPYNAVPPERLLSLDQFLHRDDIPNSERGHPIFSFPPAQMSSRATLLAHIEAGSFPLAFPPPRKMTAVGFQAREADSVLIPNSYTTTRSIESQGSEQDEQVRFEAHRAYVRLRIKEERENQRLLLTNRDASLLQEPLARAIITIFAGLCIDYPLGCGAHDPVIAEWVEQFVLGTSSMPLSLHETLQECNLSDFVCERVTNDHPAAGVGIVLNLDPIDFSTAYRVYRKCDATITSQLDDFVKATPPPAANVLSAVKHYIRETKCVKGAQRHHVPLESESVRFAKADNEQNFMVDGCIKDPTRIFNMISRDNPNPRFALRSVKGAEGPVDVVSHHAQFLEQNMTYAADVALSVQQHVIPAVSKPTNGCLFPTAKAYAETAKRTAGAVKCPPIPVGINRRPLPTPLTRQMAAIALSTAWNDRTSAIRLGINTDPIRKHLLKLTESAATPLVWNSVDRALLKALENSPEMETAAAFMLCSPPGATPDAHVLYRECSKSILRTAADRTAIPLAGDGANHVRLSAISQPLGAWFGGHKTLDVARRLALDAAPLYDLQPGRPAVHYLLPLCPTTGGGDTLGARHIARLAFPERTEDLFIPELDKVSKSHHAECALRHTLRSSEPSHAQKCGSGWKITPEALRIIFSRER